MYHRTRIDDGLAVTPANYRDHSVGFRRQDLIGRESGSHHMTMSVAVLDVDGRIDTTVHSYEKSLWMLDGALTVAMLGQSITLQRNDCAVVPVGVSHQLTAGASGARWLEMSAPVRLLLTDHRNDTFFLPEDLGTLGAASVDLRDPRNKNFFRFDEASMDMSRLARGSDPSAPEVSASMATAMLAYSGIGVRMLADQRTSAQLHTMFMVEYQPTAVAHPHDHPFEEAYIFTAGETEAVINRDTFTMRPGDVLWTGSGCDHAFYNRTDGKTQWVETQAPQPPAQHSYRFNRDWEYLSEELCAGTRVDPQTSPADACRSSIMTSPGAVHLIPEFDGATPLVFRRAMVVTVDTPGVIPDADVLVVGDRIAAVGPALQVPPETVEIDASGGILMPGMIDTHRHMWQANLRGLGADWTLSEYFTFYYLNWGKYFRPEDIYAGNLLSGVESVDAGVTTTVDWSHGLQTIDHGEAAADALLAAGGRFVLAYGNLLGAPWEWSTDPAFHSFVERRSAGTDALLTLQLAFDVTGDPAFPERAAFEAACSMGLRVTTHAGVWEATNDTGIRQMWDGGFMDETVTYVHCSTLSEDSYRKIAATGGTASVAAESEMNGGQGYPPTFLLRRYGIPISLSQDTSVWWSSDIFAAMRSTLHADRARCHLEAHRQGRTVTFNEARAEDAVHWATLGGARAIGRESDLGSITVGKKADLVLLKNDAAPAMRPILHPYGHIVYQAGRGDVHTVVVDGRVLKYDHRLRMIDLASVHARVERTVEYIRSTMGERAWQEAVAPVLAVDEPIANPYTYSAVDGREAHLPSR